VLKREWFFQPDNLPENYHLYISDDTKALFKKTPAEKENAFNYPIGVTTYDNFFSHKELEQIETQVEETEKQCENRAFLPMTA